MKRAHQLYLFRRQLIIAALISFMLNGILGWLLYQPLFSLGGWRDSIIVVDALVMTLLTAFVIGPFVLPHAEQKIRRAQLPPVARHSRSRAWVRRLPVDVMGRTTVVGLAAAIVVVPLVLSLTIFQDQAAFSLTQLVLIRAVVTGLGAGLMAVLFMWIGLVDAS